MDGFRCNYLFINSLQEFHTRRTLQRGERHIKVANGVKVEVEAIRELPLELNDGFVLKLTDVLYCVET